jgi:hypothetical protein
MGKKAQLRAVDTVALQLGHRVLEPFRIVENGYRLADRGILHAGHTVVVFTAAVACASYSAGEQQDNDDDQ